MEFKFLGPKGLSKSAAQQKQAQNKTELEVAARKFQGEYLVKKLTVKHQQGLQEMPEAIPNLTAREYKSDPLDMESLHCSSAQMSISIKILDRIQGLRESQSFYETYPEFVEAKNLAKSYGKMYEEARFKENDVNNIIKIIDKHILSVKSSTNKDSIFICQSLLEYTEGIKAHQKFWQQLTPELLNSFGASSGIGLAYNNKTSVLRRCIKATPNTLVDSLQILETRPIFDESQVAEIESVLAPAYAKAKAHKDAALAEVFGIWTQIKKELTKEYNALTITTKELHGIKIAALNEAAKVKLKIQDQYSQWANGLKIVE